VGGGAGLACAAATREALAAAAREALASRVAALAWRARRSAPPMASRGRRPAARSSNPTGGAQWWPHVR